MLFCYVVRLAPCEGALLLVATVLMAAASAECLERRKSCPYSIVLLDFYIDDVSSFTANKQLSMSLCFDGLHKCIG